MARCYLSVFFLLLCAACATPHDLVKVPGVEPEQACTLLEEAGYDPGGCWSIMDTDQMRQSAHPVPGASAPATGRRQPQPGHLGCALNTVVRAKHKQRAALAAPPKASPAAKHAPTKAPVDKRAASPPPPPPPPPPLEVGAKVFVLERAKCLPRSGAWVLAYVGVVQSLEGDKVLVTLLDRISYRFNPGEEGVESKDWFCVPRRRHCYSSVPFGDWGGAHRSGEMAVFDKGKVRRAAHNPKDTLYDLARDYCR